MADQTNLFKATVKTIRSRLKSQGQTVPGSSNILSQSRPKGEFAVRAKDVVGGISKLKDFLMKHRKAYLQSGSLLMSEDSKMTDAERDMIDTDAQTFIRTCREAIQSLKGEANNKIPHQVKMHRDGVFNLIEEYLKAVCKIYSEQRAVRVKRVVDRKRISRLEPEKILPRRSLLNQEIPNQKKSKAEEPKASSSNNASPIEESMPLPENDMLTPEEQQLFEQENQQLLEDMHCIVDEVKQIEGKVVEISRLQEIFTDKVLEQEKDVDRIADTVVGSTENIKEANEEIREAMKNNAGIRIWILFFLIVLSFTLLFLDWYNP